MLLFTSYLKPYLTVTVAGGGIREKLGWGGGTGISGISGISNTGEWAWKLECLMLIPICWILFMALLHFLSCFSEPSNR